MVKNTIDTLNEIIRLYDNALDNIGKKSFKKHRQALSSYLFHNGLIKKTSNISVAKQFLKDFEKEIISLKDSDLTEIEQVLWKLQTGEIILISELIYIDRLSLPVHLIESIHKNPKIGYGGKKKKSSKSKKKKSTKSKKKK